MSTPAQTAPIEMELTRIIHAPRALVWQAWTEVDKLQQWWGPQRFTNPRCEIDLRPGGRIRIDMRAPDGIIYPMGGEFEQIVPPERLVFLTSALDEQGEPIFVNRNTVLFREVDGGTEISIHTVVIEATPHAMQYLKGMREGWTSSLDKLADFLKSLYPPRTKETAMKTDLHLVFPGNCREAFAFYEKTFNSKIQFSMTFGEAPEGSPVPPDSDNLIMHTSMPLGSALLMGCDAPKGREATIGGFQISVKPDSTDEVQRLFDELKAGGSVQMPLGQTFWSPLFGMCTDKFGVGWMVSVPGPQM